MAKLLALGVLLIPALAVAQPDASDRPAVIIVNPPPQEARRTVIETPQTETVYDAYNMPMFTTGALLFIGSYGSSVVVAAAADDAERARNIDRLYIPLAGPWLALSARGDCPANPTCDRETTKQVLLVMDGIFQAAGVIIMIDGVLQPTSTVSSRRRRRSTRRSTSHPPSSPRRATQASRCSAASDPAARSNNALPVAGCRA